jgi:hypothetical protein
MKYKFKTTGSFVLLDYDDSNNRYLLLKFDDGFTRKLSKGGNWPPEYALACLEKAKNLKGKSVYITTSQTTKAWETTEWLCDIKDAHIEEKRKQLALEIVNTANLEKNNQLFEKYILTSCTNGKTFFANIEPVANFFDTEEDYLDFSSSFEKGFISAWTAKNARTSKLPNDVKRIRISGLGQRTKRNGFRVVVAEVKTSDTSEAFRFFHVLRIDEKSEHESYLNDSEIKSVEVLKKELEAKYSSNFSQWI